MKNGLKRAVAMMAAVVMLFGHVAIGQPWFGMTEAYAKAILASGTDENGIFWEISADGALTITGEGSVTYDSWYYYAKQITSIVIGEGITEINMGFYQNDEEYANCTSVWISSTVEKITPLAFSNIPISEIKVSGGNKCFSDIDGVLFSANKNVLICYPPNKAGTEYTIPKSVVELARGAFYGSRNLVSVDYESGAAYREILGQTFAECERLESIAVPASVDYFEVKGMYSAFYGSDKLTEITYDAEDAPHAWISGFLVQRDDFNGKYNNIKYCLPGVKECVIPESVELISYTAFDDCDNLAGFDVATGNTAFSDINGCLYDPSGKILILCPNALKELSIPASAESINDDFYSFYTFEHCRDSVESVTVAEGNTSFCVENGTLYSSDKSTIYLCTETMPIIGSAVTSIEPYSFSKPLLVLFKGTEAQWNAIQNNAFTYNYNNVIYNFVDDGSGIVADGNCGDELSWEIDKSGTLTISGNGSIPEYNKYTEEDGWSKPEWIEYISIIENIEIKNGVTSIGAFSFYDLGNERYTFSSLTLPNTLKSIGSHAFGYNRHLKSIIIPASVERIDDCAFWQYEGLEEVRIEENGKLKCIGEGVFYGSKIKEITIPASVTTLTGFPFAVCNSLENIYVESGSNNFVSVDGVLYTKDMKTLVCYPGGKTEKTFTVPNTVNFIADYAFRNNDYIRSVVLPDSVTSIGEKSFWRCSNLTSVTIPETMKYIGISAFNSSPVKDIYFGGTNEQWNSIVIENQHRLSQYGIFEWDQDSGYVAVKSAAIHCNGESDNAIDYNYNLLDDGTIEITFYLGAGGDVIVPSEINGYKVSTIADFAFCDDANIKSVVLPETVKKIETGAFYYCTSLETLYIGSEELDIRKGAFYKSGLSDVYYSGTESEWAKISVADYNTEIQNADVYCEKEELVVRNDLHNIFLKVSAWEDAIDGDTVLNVNVVDENTEGASAALAVAEALGSDHALYDITLTKDGEQVQPTSSVEVSIPLTDDLASMECSVYNINKDGSYENMNALRSENTLTFVTDHFSYYAVIGSAPLRLPGDINSDGKISLLDSTLLRRYLAGWNGVTISESNADVNGDGEVTLLDSTLLRRYLAGWSGVELQ